MSRWHHLNGVRQRCLERNKRLPEVACALNVIICSWNWCQSLRITVSETSKVEGKGQNGSRWIISASTRKTPQIISKTERLRWWEFPWWFPLSFHFFSSCFSNFYRVVRFSRTLFEIPIFSNSLFIKWVFHILHIATEVYQMEFNSFQIWIWNKMGITVGVSGPCPEVLT